jgi:WD40 repeat protein
MSGAETVYDYARFTPDGRRIVAASTKGWTRIWSAETGKPVSRPLGGHTGAVTSASLSPDGRTLASGSTDGTVRLYDLASEKPLGGPLPGVPNRRRHACTVAGRRLTRAEWADLLPGREYDPAR